MCWIRWQIVTRSGRLEVLIIVIVRYRVLIATVTPRRARSRGVGRRHCRARRAYVMPRTLLVAMKETNKVLTRRPTMTLNRHRLSVGHGAWTRRSAATVLLLHHHIVEIIHKGLLRRWSGQSVVLEWHWKAIRGTGSRRIRRWNHRVSLISRANEARTERILCAGGR